MSHLPTIEAAQARAEQVAKLLKDHDDLSKVVVISKSQLGSIREALSHLGEFFTCPPHGDGVIAVELPRDAFRDCAEALNIINQHATL